MTIYVYVSGGVMGLRFIGPFYTNAAAQEYAAREGDDGGPWWIAPLEDPDE